MTIPVQSSISGRRPRLRWVLVVRSLRMTLSPLDTNDQGAPRKRHGQPLLHPMARRPAFLLPSLWLKATAIRPIASFKHKHLVNKPLLLQSRNLRRLGTEIKAKPFMPAKPSIQLLLPQLHRFKTFPPPRDFPGPSLILLRTSHHIRQHTTLMPKPLTALRAVFVTLQP